ncbi:MULTISPECIES: hypothetical protein [unclassified Streptomyces]|uniref:hypothetical protein n=1 Tax=unclassified Streptomyces TaxID=2593676 RepID=UPI001BE9F843|nr:MULTISPECIES: hypothetical protein [unclassified Streptomyces]MBT2408455.1 hypothetical protein [Streptomyces sp. ISL-21]MBT2611901.1 hypothetical protein [Streptomyces sp. ISL-87]
MATASAVLLAARGVFDSDTFQNCHYLGPSTRMYVTSWAGLACAVGSLLVYTALRRSAHRHGPPAGAAWQRRLAAVSAAIALVLVLVLLMAVYTLYAPDPSGGNDCSGLFPITG